MNKEEIKQKDKEDKAIKFYTNYIKAQEKELEWMYRQDEEYYRDEIEQKELLIKGFRTILNLIQKQEKEINKLKTKNNDLLRKIRNRAKEVNKLIKYSTYKKEFSNLNKRIEKQEKIIDKMAEYIANEDVIEEFCRSRFKEKEPCDEECKECIKEYFKKEVEKDV